MNLFFLNLVKNFETFSCGKLLIFELRKQPHFAQLQERGTKVVCNAGGVNPTGCAEAMAKAAEKAGFPDLKIAAIGGDQVFQDGFMTSNAYFGCESVVEALKKGADIVLTGRLTDSALILGPAAYEFGWKMNDWDKLAAGSCAGHIVECGAQVNNFSFVKAKVKFFS